MKRCPTCGLTLDDSLGYCTNDGTPLPESERKPYDPQATLVVAPGDMPTTPPSQPQPTGWQPARPTAPPGAYAPRPAYQPQQQQQPTGPRPGKFVPGLVGGLVGGLLSLFADFLPTNGFIVFSFFCVVWAMMGGAVAARLYVKRSEVPVRQGEGALLGLLAGAIGAVIYVAVDTMIAYAIHAQGIEEFYTQQGQEITAGVFFAIMGTFGAITVLGFSVLGGIIGVAMFEKRRAYHMSAPPPPPPPGFGPPPGTYR